MSAKKRKTDSLSLPAYQGLVARVCGVLNITPVCKGPTDDKLRLEKEALAEWCNEQQNKQRMAREAEEMFR